MIEEFKDKFYNILSKGSLYKLQEVYVSKEKNDTYLLFNKFYIEKISKDNILVSKIDSNISHSFYNFKDAVAWCVFYDTGKLYEADRVLELDQKLDGLETDIFISKRLFKNSKTVEDRILYLTKLSENKLKKASYTKQIQILLQDSKRLQLKRFTEMSKP